MSDVVNKVTWKSWVHTNSCLHNALLPQQQFQAHMDFSVGTFLHVAGAQRLCTGFFCMLQVHDICVKMFFCMLQVHNV